MKKHKNWPISICSWSLQTDVAGVAEALAKLDVEHVHLELAPAVAKDGGAEVLAAIQAQNWTITSTMIGFPTEDYSTLDTIKVTGGVMPDDAWDANRELAIDCINLTAKLGVKYASTHAGFLDHTNEANAQKFYERLKCLADAAQAAGVTLLLETGQESADDLRQFLEQINHPALGVNFDPANMILYNKGEPLQAVRVLAPWIRHVHIKDATCTKVAGEWGAEVPWGDGEVGGNAFLDTLAEIGYEGAIAIEREAGDCRFDDIQKAVNRLT